MGTHCNSVGDEGVPGVFAVAPGGGGSAVSTVTVYDDEIATLAADDAELPIGRLTVSAARFEVSRGGQRCYAL